MPANVYFRDAIMVLATFSLSGIVVVILASFVSEWVVVAALSLSIGYFGGHYWYRLLRRIFSRHKSG
jgi:hypothetical protein